jgi:hypothetical protein
MDDDVTDIDWWSHAEQQYEECWREFVGSPESFRAGANWLYGNGEFGAAALMFQKAIDLLHTVYCSPSIFFPREPAATRQPSSADLPIIDGYSSALGATLALHPDAPVGRSITEVTHRLTDIFFTCKRAGIPAGLYGNALRELEPTARRYGLFIDRSAFEEARPTVIHNQGIIASHSTVSGNALAFGEGAHSTVVGASSSATAEQITALLRQFLDELSRSDHADKSELESVAADACHELAQPTPRLTRLRVLGSGLAATVRGAGSLAALAIQIEQAIRGL